MMEKTMHSMPELNENSMPGLFPQLAVYVAGKDEKQQQQKKWMKFDNHIYSSLRLSFLFHISKNEWEQTWTRQKRVDGWRE